MFEITAVLNRGMDIDADSKTGDVLKGFGELNYKFYGSMRK
jgi:hypothetical protein